MFVTIATREERMTEKKHEAKRYILKHFKFPISILYSDPKESLPKAIELLLKDIGENGLLNWDVEEVKIESTEDKSEADDNCCPPAPPKAKQSIIPHKFKV